MSARGLALRDETRKDSDLSIYHIKQAQAGGAPGFAIDPIKVIAPSSSRRTSSASLTPLVPSNT